MPFERWHASICKNVAARVAWCMVGGAAVYANLHCDNIMTVNVLIVLITQALDMVPSWAVGLSTAAWQRVLGDGPDAANLREGEWGPSVVMTHANPEVSSTTGRSSMSMAFC